MRASLCLVLLATSACSDDPCEGISGACTPIEAGASAETVQTAFIDAKPGSTIAFAAGTYNFKVGLSLDVDDVTLTGAGRDATILSFKAQTDGAEGVLVTADGVTVTKLAIEDTPGDGLKFLGAAHPTMRDMRVEWTRGPNEDNGAYGLYPVQCTDVLIEDTEVYGASDAGIYVGQSNRIIVTRNRVEKNVAGIEIENSTNADVFANTTTANTGGVLVFNLPGLDVANGSTTRVFDNEIFENNQDNFAPPGNIVGLVPRGTGIAILAAHQVEIFDNTIRDNESINIGMISYVPTGNPVDDPRYDQYPTAIDIHDNRISGTSDEPTGPLGALLILGLSELGVTAPYIVPDIVWDGVRDPMRGDVYGPADKICIREAADVDFMDMHYPTDDATLPTRDITPHQCSHAPLPEVVLQ